MANFQFYQDTLQKISERWNASEELFHLRQVNSVREYQAQFTDLASRVTHLSEKLLVKVFIGGLKDGVRQGVRTFGPSSLSEAHGLALIYEHKLERDHQDALPKLHLVHIVATTPSLVLEDNDHDEETKESNGNSPLFCQVDSLEPSPLLALAEQTIYGDGPPSPLDIFGDQSMEPRTYFPYMACSCMVVDMFLVRTSTLLRVCYNTFVHGVFWPRIMGGKDIFGLIIRWMAPPPAQDRPPPINLEDKVDLKRDGMIGTKGYIGINNKK